MIKWKELKLDKSSYQKWKLYLFLPYILLYFVNFIIPYYTLLYFEHLQAKNLQPQNKIAKQIDINNNAHTEVCISIGDVLVAPIYLHMVLKAR